MRVVHLSSYGGRGGGGGASSAHRVHEGLLEHGIDSSMLCLRTKVSDPHVVALGERGVGMLRRAMGHADRLSAAPFRPDPRAMWTTGLVGVGGVAEHALVRAADVISIYWVHAGFLSVGELGRVLSLGKPVVWRLSDMWAFTGGCHYGMGCEGYLKSCGNCPQLARSGRFDLSYLMRHDRERSWDLSKLTLVTPSGWLAGECGRSSLLRDVPVEVIYTGIDLAKFKPHRPAVAREVLGLPQDAKLILCGARGGVADKRKGGHLAVEALKTAARVAPDRNAHFVFFGGEGAVDFDPSRTHALGTLHDELSLSLAYSACDVFLAPSLQDNLPQTVLEAMACGCPVVGFRNGGVDDGVRHGETGLLCDYGSAPALADALLRLLRDDDLAARMRVASRALAENEFSMARQARDFAELYRRKLASTQH